MVDSQLTLLARCEAPPAPAMRGLRHWQHFDSEESADRWGLRHQPIVPPGMRLASLHPRTRETALGIVLVYDVVCRGAAKKAVLVRRGELEVIR